MPYEIETEYGKVKLSDRAIGRIVWDAMKSEEIQNKIKPGGRKGHIVKLEEMGSEPEWESFINVSKAPAGRMVISVSVIVRFGVSIKKLIKSLSDTVADEVKRRLGEKPARIDVTVEGVYSKHLAARHMEISHYYEDE
jgi:uncharacterized alkaline shock family protein YloU